jgi:branched-chain amino acid transport system ATP-binding protein
MAPAQPALETALLEAVDVRKHYGEVVALDGVSLAVRESEVVAIIGPNGAGKTTLVNVLSGLAPPTAGRIHFKGRDITGLGPVRLARLGIARSFQLVSIFPGLRVAETLAVAVVSRLGRGRRLLAALARDTAVRDQVEAVAALFGLAERLDQRAATLPQGDKKLLDVASAFALHPDVILLDEPTSGVSTRDKHVVMEVLVGAAHRLGTRAIILVEHDLDIVFGYAHRIVVLDAGRVLADGPPDAIRRDPAVAEAVIGRRA